MGKQPTPAKDKQTHPTGLEIIDRSKPLEFLFDGRKITAYAGDTIGSALARAGVNVLSRSFKYHRPRGLMCCAGYCPNCLVRVGDEPNVRACTRAVEPGMDVRAQNAWPSLEQDVMSLTSLADRFLPVGFYYKSFMRPQALWPTYEHFLRKAAGLGVVDANTAPDDYDKVYLHTDVAVVGGGHSGMQAAIAAAQQGARVLLFDDQPALGGRQRYTSGSSAETLPDQLSQVAQHPQLKTFTNTTVLGYWEDHWMSAVQGNRLYKIRAKAVIFATGVYEQPLVFENNDLPGVMLGSGVQRLLNLYGVKPGKQALIVTNNEQGYRVANNLLNAGIGVAGVVDEREGGPNDYSEQISQAGVPIYRQHTLLAAKGRDGVQQAVLAALGKDGVVAGTGHKTIECDLISVSIGWAPANGLLYQAGAIIEASNESNQFIVKQLPPGVFATGSITGQAQGGGATAGLMAALHAGIGTPSEIDQMPPAAQTSPSHVPVPTQPHVCSQGKRFICFCEDVTHTDLETAIAEGYDSIELLKRYSTISMGPCQGKMCSTNAIQLCARALKQSVAETGTTTSRPPMSPVKLGALAGQVMEPVQLTPIDHWHREHGANMMVAGLWIRPEHYGDPLGEVRAVREGVGIIDVSTLGKYRITGPGAPQLLERLYINKWQNLAVGRVRYGIMCNDEGVILDDGVSARLGDQEWYMTTTSSGANSMFEWIQWWVQSGWGKDVHVQNRTEDFAAFNLTGPRARDVLRSLTDVDLNNAAFPYLHVREFDIAGVACRVMRIGFTGELSYEIHCPSAYGPHVWEALLNAGAAQGIRPFGVEAQRVLRLEKAHIIVGQDTDALSDPISADSGWAVKLDKDDFLGQRPLARVAAQGPLQKLVGFTTKKIDVVPEEGLQIVQSTTAGNLEIIGWVTSSRWSPTVRQVIGLCWLPADLADKPSATFMIYRDGQLVEATVHHGPFYDPEGSRLRG